MFRRFCTWIDSWNDSFSPIVVRDVRRTIGGMASWGIMSVILSTVVFIGALALVQFRPFGFIPFIYGTPAVLLGIALLGLTGCLMIPPIGWDKTRWGAAAMEPPEVRDENFRLTALTPGDWVVGMISTSIIYGLFAISPVLPPLVASQLFGPFQFWPFAALLNFFLLVQCFLLHSISYEALIKTRLGSDILSTITTLLVPLYTLPWGAALTVGFLVFRWSPLQWNSGALAFGIWFAFPATLLAACLCFYRLTLYHFRHRTPLLLGIALNCCVGFLLSLAGATLFLGGCRLLFGVC